LSWLTSIKTGVRFTENDYETGKSELSQKDMHKNLVDADGNPDIIWMDDIAAAFPGSIITPDVGSDAFEHSGFAGANHLRNFRVYDAKRLQNANQTYEMLQQLWEGTNLGTGHTLAQDRVEKKGSYSLIGEETSAVYLQANMDFGRWRAVTGGRYVETEISSTAYDQDGNDLVVESQKYNDFLPSLNITYDLTDDTLLRFAAAKVMRRADYSELSPTYIFNTARHTADKGNPGLKPYRATQYDLAVEHYFGHGNMVSATIFYKDVASFLKTTGRCDYVPDALAGQNQSDATYHAICLKDFENRFENSTDYYYAKDRAEFDAAVAEGRHGIQTTLPDNGEKGKIQGFELGYQQAFDFLPGAWSGLGLNANYTYADSEDPNGLALEDI